MWFAAAGRHSSSCRRIEYVLSECPDEVKLEEVGVVVDHCLAWHGDEHPGFELRGWSFATDSWPIEH